MIMDGRITQVQVKRHYPQPVNFLGGNYGHWESQRLPTAIISIQVTGDALYQFRRIEDLLGGMARLSIGCEIPRPQKWPGTDDALQKWIYCSACNGKGCKTCSWSGSMVATLPRCEVCGGIQRVTQKQCGYRHD